MLLITNYLKFYVLELDKGQYLLQKIYGMNFHFCLQKYLPQLRAI